MQTKKKLEKKIALIAGGGQIPGETIGNGRATALTFAKEGAKIVVADIDINSANETVKLIKEQGGEAIAIEGDISNNQDSCRFVSETIKSYGNLNILQNNVGIGPGKSGPNKISLKRWKNILDVNLTGMFLMIKNVLPIMQKQRSGVITNISSTISIAGNSTVRGNEKNLGNGEGQTAYRVSKSGVNSLTESFALSQAKYGIRVNAILPGLMETPNAVESAIQSSNLTRDELKKLRDEQVPLLNKQGTGWDIANAALFFASEEARFITGVLLPVDGGLNLKRG
jgi:NAD(P)-dependent dehydrogenase (short-subunit alcohol dehydrogenase family)